MKVLFGFLFFMVENSKSDLILLGGGITSLAVAEMMLQGGKRVCILERKVAGAESSWAGGGILSPLCPWDYPDAVTRLTTFGAQRYRAWAHELHEATGIDPEYVASGMQVLPPFAEEKALAWCGQHGVRVSVNQDGLLLPDVAQVRNPRLVQALRKRVEMLGGRIIEHCEVRAIHESAGKIVSITTACGEFQAERFIVAAGAWSRLLLGKFALQLEIKPIRGQMLLFKFDAPPIKHILLQDGLYLIPRRDGHLLVGSTLEDVGFDKRVTQAAKDDLHQRASQILPALREMQPVQHWSGLRPGSPDNIPTIDRHPDLENLYINSGQFRYGVTMAPASAEIMLNLLEGRPQPFDVLPYKFNKIK